MKQSSGPAPAAEYAVELKNLSKSFDGVRAVRDVNMKIRDGEFIVFIGPSGCGKTTTLRMIAGLEQPSNGEVHSYGKRIDHLKAWERETPLVWQNFALFPFMTVAKNRSIAQLSGGQKQCIARQATVLSRNSSA
jgi:spermidine/putrescine transport system ATP-binding protein